jgi:radical SAM superfamily enzyme YgiQ (UPF0313 family)
MFLLNNSGMYERLGMMGLAALLRRDGHQPKLIVTDTLSNEELIARVEEFDPPMIAYTIMTGEHNYHLGLNQMLKEHHKFFAVFGGPHPTFDNKMIYKPGVDAICIGEGDIGFPELVNRMEQGKDYLDIQNFWFRDGDMVVKNPIGQLVEDLDTLPFPDRDFMYEADPATGSRGYKTLISMRGCPFQCTYCFNHVYNKMTKGKGEMLRYRSVDNVIQEMVQLREKYPLSHMAFEDDIFELRPPGWHAELAERLPKEIGVPFSCSVRANLITDDIGRMMGEAGCKFAWMGVECGNYEVARTLLKRHLPNEKIEHAIEVFRKHGVQVFTQNILGLPVDNPLEIDMQTLDFNIKLRPAFAWSSILYPYPETEIGKTAIEKRMFDPNYDKVLISNKSDSCLTFEDPKVKRKLVNLHKLFGVTVQFPILRPMIPFLIRLPLTRLYTFIFFAFYGYKLVLKNSSWKERFRTGLQYVRFFLRYVSGLERRKTFSRAAQKTRYPASPTLPDNRVANEIPIAAAGGGGGGGACATKDEAAVEARFDLTVVSRSRTIADRPPSVEDRGNA